MEGLEDLEDIDLEDLEDLDLDDGMTDGGAEELVDLPVDSEDEVLTCLLQDPVVWDWFMSAADPLYEITDENTSYAVYLYEVTDGVESPFGYYAVDKETGEVYAVVAD